MPVFSNEERPIRAFFAKKSSFLASENPVGWDGMRCFSECSIYQIEEAVVTDRFLLAVAEHR
jgi:hypothetical protein